MLVTRVAHACFSVSINKHVCPAVCCVYKHVMVKVCVDHTVGMYHCLTVVLQCVSCYSLCPHEKMCVDVNVPGYVTEGVQRNTCVFLHSHFVIHGNKS